MQIEVKIDASCREPKLTIQTAEMTEEIVYDRRLALLGNGCVQPLCTGACFIWDFCGALCADLAVFLSDWKI